MVEDEPGYAGRRARDAWVDQQMRAASRPPVQLMRDTIITGIGAGLATSLCGVLILGLGCCSISRSSAAVDDEGGGLPCAASESVSARLGDRVVSGLADHGGGGCRACVGAFLAGGMEGHWRLLKPK
jgi:hypothetical protein